MFRISNCFRWIMVVWTTVPWVMTWWITIQWAMTQWTTKQWTTPRWSTPPWLMRPWFTNQWQGQVRTWWWWQWRSTAAAQKLFFSIFGASLQWAAWWVNTSYLYVSNFDFCNPDWLDGWVFSSWDSIWRPEILQRVSHGSWLQVIPVF